MSQSYHKLRLHFADSSGWMQSLSGLSRGGASNGTEETKTQQGEAPTIAKIYMRHE
jgi:hypothetical protein